MKLMPNNSHSYKTADQVRQGSGINMDDQKPEGSAAGLANPVEDILKTSNTVNVVKPKEKVDPVLYVEFECYCRVPNRITTIAL